MTRKSAALFAIVAAVAVFPVRAQICSPFTDVSAQDTFCAEIQWMLNRSVTAGCTGNQYRPANFVRRDQMAAFIFLPTGTVDPDLAVTAPNRVIDPYGTVGGGVNRAGNNDGQTSVYGAFATVGGGVNNIAAGHGGTVAGGGHNTADAYGAIAGGAYNATGNGWSAVAGGYLNTASGQLSTVGGGRENTASGEQQLRCWHPRKSDQPGIVRLGGLEERSQRATSPASRSPRSRAECEARNDGCRTA